MLEVEEVFLEEEEVYIEEYNSYVTNVTNWDINPMNVLRMREGTLVKII